MLVGAARPPLPGLGRCPHCSAYHMCEHPPPPDNWDQHRHLLSLYLHWQESHQSSLKGMSVSASIRHRQRMHLGPIKTIHSWTSGTTSTISALRRKIPGVLFQLSKKLLRLRIISIWREFFKDINGLWSAIKVWSVFLPKTTNPVSRLLMVKLVWMVGSFKDRLKGSICVGRRRISIWGNKRIKHFLAWSTRHSRENCSPYLFEPNSKAHQKFRLSLKTVGKIS